MYNDWGLKGGTKKRLDIYLLVTWISFITKYELKCTGLVVILIEINISHKDITQR